MTRNDVISKSPPEAVQVNHTSSNGEMNFDLLLVCFCIFATIVQRFACI